MGKGNKRKPEFTSESSTRKTKASLSHHKLVSKSDESVPSGSSISKKQFGKGKQPAKGSRTINHVDSAIQNQQQQQISVYKRPCQLPKSPDPSWFHPVNRFLTPKDKQFQETMATCYDGCIIQSGDTMPTSFHTAFASAFEDLDTNKIFQFDLTQPAGLGSKIAKTYVTRCLVGDPGITYKYLGLRMFAHPWTAGELGALPTFVAIGNLNQQLIKETSQHLKSLKRPMVGSCNYNLTLINRCFPLNHETVSLKEEPTFQREKCTVSWHADSSLEHFSTIAVYHAERGLDQLSLQANPTWKLALKVSPHAEGPSAGKLKSEHPEEVRMIEAPPVAIPLPSRSIYYLCDDFNHHHQHSVLAGITDRFASTHRVSRCDGHTYQSIKAKCQAALQGSSMGHKQLRVEQLALHEVEFEWIRQFYIQGQSHCDRLVWWQEPMKILYQYWQRLEMKTAAAVEALLDAQHSSEQFTKDMEVVINKLPEEEQKKMKKRVGKRKLKIGSVELKSYEVMLEALQERLTKRKGWFQRENDPIFKSVPRDAQPMKLPWDIDANELPMIIKQIETARDVFQQRSIK